MGYTAERNSTRIMIGNNEHDDIKYVVILIMLYTCT
jgi:hypothetical protein